jgi:hypothetical protein
MDMDSTDPDPTPLPIVDQDAPACRHLRSAGMYLSTDDPDRERRVDYDNTAYWCLRSFTNFGPDDEIVGRPECCNPSRSCYEPI